MMNSRFVSLGTRIFVLITLVLAVARAGATTIIIVSGTITGDSRSVPHTGESYVATFYFNLSQDTDICALNLCAPNQTYDYRGGGAFNTNQSDGMTLNVQGHQLIGFPTTTGSLLTQFVAGGLDFISIHMNQVLSNGDSYKINADSIAISDPQHLYSHSFPPPGTYLNQLSPSQNQQLMYLATPEDEMYGTITSITFVPEPSSISLVLLTLAATRMRQLRSRYKKR